MLNSGVEIKKALKLAATKTGDVRARQALAEINDAVGRGADVSSAMRGQSGAFPDLLIDMVDVAEQTGSLPEILHSLAEHYENNLRLRRDFLKAISWPMFQLVAAVLIIAFVILLLGWIAEMQEKRQGQAIDVLGWGLTGTSGAVTWLTIVFGSAAALFVGYQILIRSMQGKRSLDSLLMRIPVLGGCMRSFGIARFSWAFSLTQQAGMPIDNSLEASLRATGNGAFVGATGQICGDVREGCQLGEALSSSRLFPADYIEMVHVGETSGTVPEMLERLSPQFEDQARRSLSMLVSALGWLVWAIVAGFIIFVVFSIMSWYIGMLKEFM